MVRMFQALRQGLRFARACQSQARIADDAASVTVRDLRSLMERCWDEVERPATQRRSRQVLADQEAMRGGGSAATTILLARRPADVDFPG